MNGSRKKEGKLAATNSTLLTARWDNPQSAASREKIKIVVGSQALASLVGIEIARVRGLIDVGGGGNEKGSRKGLCKRAQAKSSPSQAVQALTNSTKRGKPFSQARQLSLEEAPPLLWAQRQTPCEGQFGGVLIGAQLDRLCLGDLEQRDTGCDQLGEGSMGALLWILDVVTNSSDGNYVDLESGDSTMKRGGARRASMMRNNENKDSGET
ncbi:hypothetical protein C8R45DRAFT_941154 [Mycena sanguinolenta]|nr:hypothetical protein C8R45DRAFT_941154 [Mycena sanguinolenta]